MEVLFFPSRPRRVLAAVLVTAGASLAFAACGGDDEAVTRPGGSAPVAAECKDDGDCAGTGGKCKSIGGKKACLYSKSCNGKTGADASCGGTAGNEQAAGTQDCCAASAVTGGSYDRFNNPDYPAKVSSFIMDTFEVTVGRFRAYVEATKGNLRAAAPAAGTGAHPKVPNSGWRTEWNAELPSSVAELEVQLGPTAGTEGCQVGGNLDDFGALTYWTAALDAKVKKGNARNQTTLAENTKEALDRKPLNCVSWYVLFAFCIWDGGRLPTDAEWGYAAAGGAEQRPFPWAQAFETNELVHINDDDRLSLEPIYSAGAKLVTAALYDGSGENSLIQYKFTWGGKEASKLDNALHIAPAGRKAAGNGKWGHADLAGSVYEWTLDRGPIQPKPCDDCADVAWPSPSAADPKGAPSQIEDFTRIDGKEDKRWYKGGARSVRGGAWDNVLGMSNTQSELEIAEYTNYPVGRTYRSLGGRCVRDF